MLMFCFSQISRFITWLQEAEEESDDDVDSDEGEWNILTVKSRPKRYKK